jgi:hypothetical protein
MFNPGGLSCGANPGVTGDPPDYASPFKFTGVLHEVTINVCGDLIEDPRRSCEPTWPANKTPESHRSAN